MNAFNLFASLNRTFHLSPHENSCTIALITIHYLYNFERKGSKMLLNIYDIYMHNNTGYTCAITYVSTS